MPSFYIYSDRSKYMGHADNATRIEDRICSGQKASSPLIVLICKSLRRCFIIYTFACIWIVNKQSAFKSLQSQAQTLKKLPKNICLRDRCNLKKNKGYATSQTVIVRKHVHLLLCRFIKKRGIFFNTIWLLATDLVLIRGSRKTG